MKGNARMANGDGEHDAIARWLACFFCGAPMRANEARHIPAPFSALPLPACGDCALAREQAHSAHGVHGVHSSAPSQEAK